MIDSLQRQRRGRNQHTTPAIDEWRPLSNRDYFQTPLPQAARSRPGAAVCRPPDRWPGVVEQCGDAGQWIYLIIRSLRTAATYVDKIIPTERTRARCSCACRPFGKVIFVNSNGAVRGH